MVEQMLRTGSGSVSRRGTACLPSP